jgi:23S rRNA (uracil1939-C5)-methyltransferase
MTNISVTDLAAEGKAIAKAEGKVIFIQGAIPGDVVDIRIVKSKKDWAEAKLERILEPSPNRILPFCAHFGVCGGCKWQMLPYPLQLQYKQNEVLQNLKRLGKIEIPTPERPKPAVPQ